MHSENVSLQILCDGRNSRVTGREIINRQRDTGLKPLHSKEYVELFKSNNPILEKMKAKIHADTVFIFCMDTFSTPHFDGGDQSVLYFCWIEQFQDWYSTYWRINDTWNVIAATLVIAG